jgi:hypothetical protein
VARHKYAAWFSLLGSVGLFLWAAGRIVPNPSFGINLPTILTTVGACFTILSILIRERRPSVYLLVLTGSFGTIYPMASVEKSSISTMADKINAQVRTIRPNQKPPLFQRAPL